MTGGVAPAYPVPAADVELGGCEAGAMTLEMVWPCSVLKVPLVTIWWHWDGERISLVRPDIYGTAFSYPHSPQMWVVRVLTTFQTHLVVSPIHMTWATSNAAVGWPSFGVGAPRLQKLCLSKALMYLGREQSKPKTSVLLTLTGRWA